MPNTSESWKDGEQRQGRWRLPGEPTRMGKGWVYNPRLLAKSCGNVGGALNAHPKRTGQLNYGKWH
jgi:hypothetical protein